MKFIAYPDDSAAGRSRFMFAMMEFRCKVLRMHEGVGGLQFLLECENRESFAAAAGSSKGPVWTEDAPAARVPERSSRNVRHVGPWKLWTGHAPPGDSGMAPAMTGRWFTGPGIGGWIRTELPMADLIRLLNMCDPPGESTREEVAGEHSGERDEKKPTRRNA